MFSRKKRVSPFTSSEKRELINWKSTGLLRHFTTRFGNIKPRHFTGLKVSDQKKVRQAVIRARELGLMHYIK